MNSEEIKQIKETLKYYETTKTEPTYCEELITTGELKRIVEEIKQKENIIKEAKDFINGKNLKENEYRFAEDFDFAKLLEILDKVD